MSKVGDVMTKPVRTITPSSTMAEAARVMRMNRIGCLVVVDGDNLVGIVTERDIAYKIVAEEKGLSTTVEEAMTKDLKTTDGEKNLKDAAKLMASHLIRRLPVVEGGSLVGIITIEDIMRAEKIDEDLQAYSYT
ncbi:MAG: CBS domain-containing protein [Candidatus Hydrothermarchaeales archaeon]